MTNTQATAARARAARRPSSTTADCRSRSRMPSRAKPSKPGRQQRVAGQHDQIGEDRAARRQVAHGLQLGAQDAADEEQSEGGGDPRPRPDPATGGGTTPRRPRATNVTRPTTKSADRLGVPERAGGGGQRDNAADCQERRTRAEVTAVRERPLAPRRRPAPPVLRGEGGP